MFLYKINKQNNIKQKANFINQTNNLILNTQLL